MIKERMDMTSDNHERNVFQKLRRFFSSISQISHLGEPCKYPDCSNMTSCSDILRTRRENFASCWASFIDADADKFLSSKELEMVQTFLDANPDRDPDFLKAFPDQLSPGRFIQYFVAPRLLSEVTKLQRCTTNGDVDKKSNLQKNDSVKSSRFAKMTLEEFRESIRAAHKDKSGFNDQYVDRIAHVLFSAVQRDSAGDGQ